MKKIIVGIFLACSLVSSAQTLPDDAALRRMAANVLMVGFRGDSVDSQSDAARYIRDLHVGSIVLFDVDLTGNATIGSRNITSAAQLRKLTADLQSFCTDSLPLIIAADQEGGRVARLKPQYGFHPTVSAGYVGRCDDSDTTRHYASVMASDLAWAGVNLNLAPVVDIAQESCPVIGGLDRGYSSDPAKVAEHASLTAEEHHKRGVAVALKHFPGHGSATGDTHYGLVDVTDTWSESELLPFRSLSDTGMADAMMTAHIYLRSIDPLLPATLSKDILTGLLRQQLGYDGVIITDDMYMQGIIDKYEPAEAIVMALNAGADLLCVGNNISTGFEADRPFVLVDAIVEAVKDGRLPPERLAEASSHVNTLRARLARR